MNWDPLDLNLTDDAINATIKRQIKNILKSYTGWFDPFSELIQNALDALETRAAGDDDFTPKLWIRIDLKNKSLSVTDNGIGFSEDEFKTFLAPNISFKSQENRGNKGVGATYLAYGFNFLQVGTKSPDYEFIGTLTDGRKWVETENTTGSRPTVQQEDKALHSPFTEIDRGATFTLRLVGEFIYPKDLSQLVANTANQWSSILRIKTPLGGIYFEVEPPKIQCALTVIDQTAKETTKVLRDCKYIFPHEVFKDCLDLDEIRSARDAREKQNKDPDTLPGKYFEREGLHTYWDTNSLISDNIGVGVRLNDDQKELARQYKLKCYAFFCSTVKLWEIYNEGELGVRKGREILKGGLQLATNTMPQGELILIPLTRNIGYQHTTHIVIHLEQADPDLGRKGFQPEIEQLAKDISNHIVTSFSERWWKHLKKATGALPDIGNKAKLHQWIRQLERHEEQNPLTITREDSFLPLKKPSITAEPTSEQDVISLFNQLLAGGVIRGIRLMATSQHDQYDGIFRLHIEEPFESYQFDKDKNPLGLNSNTFEEITSEPRLLEYKYSFDALIEDFQKEIKREQDLELVVAWELGKDWATRYRITPLLHYDYLHLRPFHGSTHIISQQSTGDPIFPIIILSELIDYLNDPDSVQKYQADTYEY